MSRIGDQTAVTFGSSNVVLGDRIAIGHVEQWHECVISFHTEDDSLVILRFDNKKQLRRVLSTPRPNMFRGRILINSWRPNPDCKKIVLSCGKSCAVARKYIIKDLAGLIENYGEGELDSRKYPKHSIVLRYWEFMMYNPFF